MSEHNVVVRTDLENVVGISSEQYENNLQQELDELILVDSESEDEDDWVYQTEDENHKDVIGMIDDSTAEIEHKYVAIDNISSETRTLYLTEEEQGIISNCTDPKLKQLLIINRTKSMHLKTLCKKLWQVYEEIGINIKNQKEKFQQEVKDAKENPEIHSMAKTYTWKLGIPYFKDKSFFPAQANKDLLLKKENKELIATKIVEGRKWSQEDQKILKDAVILSYFVHRRTELLHEIRIAKAYIIQAATNKDISKDIEKLQCLEKNLRDINSEKYKPPPLHCNEEIDWIKISNLDLKGRHTYYECKAFWNIYLHPSINKTNWLPEENQQIKKLAIACNYDWDLIAKELNTNRSPYLLCVHYNTKLSDKFRRQRFLPDEDELLMEVVENCRLGDYIPWGRVAYYFEDRSKHQLYHRYKYYLSCKNVKKGTFTEAEDVLLTYLVEQFGNDYSRISQHMPQRTSIQLRNRYSSYLQETNIQLGNYTLEDDQKIMKHVQAYGPKNWTLLARNANRTRAHVRQRYLTLLRCLEKHRDLTVASLPRRKQVYFLRIQQLKNARMKVCLEKVRNLGGIPTLASVEKFLKQMERDLTKNDQTLTVLKAPVKKTQSSIDKKIIQFFQGSSKFQRQSKITDERSTIDTARRIIKLFETLGADPNLLKQPEVETDTLLSIRDEQILHSIKTILEGNKGGQNSFISGTIPLPGPSKLDPDPLVINLPPKRPIKHLLPPSVNTMVGLRCMIIKYQIYKAANKNLTTIVKSESDRTAPVDAMVWKIEQNLLQLDAIARDRITYERDLFYKRLCAMLKWPCIMSKRFPESLINIDEDTQEKEVIEKQQDKPKVGRPRRKVYNKVLKMVEAKKRKRLEIIELQNSDDGISVDGTSSIETIQPIKRKKRGRPPNQPKSEHAVAYIPRRSRIKGNEVEMDLRKKRSKRTQLEKKAPPPVNDKIKNILDLKRVNSNVASVSKDQLDRLIQLNKIYNPNKIIVYQGSTENIELNDHGPYPQQLELALPQEEVLEVTTMDPTTITQDEIVTDESHQQNNYPSETVDEIEEPNESILNSIYLEENCGRWKPTKIPNADKSDETITNITEKDSNKVIPYFDINVKTELEDEISNGSEGFSSDFELSDDLQEAMSSEEDNCSKRLKAVTESKNKLTATIQKLKGKIKLIRK